MTESTQRSETEQATPSGNEEGATLDEFRRLLAEDAGESPDSVDASSTDAGDAGESQQHAKPTEGKPKGKPKALKDLAERLELAPEDLYAIEIPLGGDGKTVKLSELKDAFAKQGDLSVRELDLEERRSKQ